MHTRKMTVAVGLLLLTGCGRGVPVPPSASGIEDHGAFVITADEEGPAILQRAEKAYGGRDKFTRWKAGVVRYTTNGALVPGLPPAAIVEDTFQLPGRFKRVVYVEADTEVPVKVLVVEQGKGWVKRHGAAVQPVEDPITERSDHPFADLYSLVPMLGPEAKLTRLHDERVGSAITGLVRSEIKDSTPFDLFIDRTTCLLVQTNRAIPTGDDARLRLLAVLFENYRDIQGGPVPMRVTASVDDQPYFELTLFDLKFVDKHPDGVFAKP